MGRVAARFRRRKKYREFASYARKALKSSLPFFWNQARQAWEEWWRERNELPEQGVRR